MYKLVIVEDDLHIRTGLSNFFPWNELGFEMVKSFENGMDALSFLTNPASPVVDVVMTDIRMPVVDGLKLAHLLNKSNHPAQVIILTAYRNFDYAQEAIKLGIKNYIVKSTKYDELVTAFRDIKTQLDKKNWAAQDTAPRPEIPANGQEQMARILRFIESDIKNATLQSVAHQFSMNPVYFSQYFKKYNNMNFIGYILQKKMEIAAKRLGLEKQSVAEVSDLLGYSSEKNFSRAFKKYYGVSPSQYRRFSRQGGDGI